MTGRGRRAAVVVVLGFLAAGAVEIGGTGRTYTRPGWAGGSMLDLRELSGQGGL